MQSHWFTTKVNYIRAVVVVALLLLHFLPATASRWEYINREQIELIEALYLPDTAFSGNAPQHIQAIATANDIVATKRNPEDESAYRLRGDAYQLLGQYQKAITDYTQAVNLVLRWKNGEQKAKTDYIQAAMLAKNGEQFGKASADYTHALKLANNRSIDLGPAYMGRGLVYEKLGKDEKAIEDYTAAVNADNNFELAAKAYLLRGRFYQRRAQYDMAKADYAAALGKGPYDSDEQETAVRYLFEIAVAHMSQGQVLSIAGDCYFAIKLFLPLIVMSLLLLVCAVFGIWVLWTAIATRTFGLAVAIVMLLVMFKLEPEYQILVKFLVCAITSHSAYRFFERKGTCWAWTLGSIAVLYNPVFQIPFERETGVLLNLCAIGVMSASVLIHKKAIKMRNDTSIQNPSGMSEIENSSMVDTAE